MTLSLTPFLALSAVLFSVGLYGILTRRNAILILMCTELMLNAANLNFAAFSTVRGDPSGQVFAIISIAIGAAEVAVGLAIMIVVYRNRHTILVHRLNLLKG